jgi:pyruvate dehydrogenase E1 component beta subunit
VEKTGRCLVVHEAAQTCGVGAEIVAQLAEKAMFFLKAPPERVTGFDTVVPYAQMEKYYIPSEKRISEAIYRLMEFT